MWLSLPFWCCLHLALICTIEGVTMSVSPSSVILGYQGTGQPVKTTFTCGGITATDVDYIASLKISRLTGREQGSTTPIVIASVRAGESGASIPDGVRDIGNRATVSGGIDTLDLKQSSIALEFQTSEFQCIDVGQYFCDLFYDDPQSNPHTSSGSTNFTASALPADTALTVKMNGFPISGTSAYPAKVKVGDEVELECYSKLGSIQNTEIEWWKTSSVGDITEQIQQNNVKFIKYNPGVFGSNGVETSGPIRDLDAECSRDQTTTLRYNVSKADQVRGIVAFKCYVQVTPPVSGSSPNVQLDPVIVNSTSFYMEIDGGGSNPVDPNAGEVAQAGTDAGLIAGVVVGAIAFIVIVVLLVYFLWYRRRGGGDTYKTREETDGSNPNLAPSAADLYSTSNKDRNRNQPDSSDMNAAPKPKPRPKKGKELHYAELDIASNIPMVAPRRPYPQDRVEYAERRGHDNRGMDVHESNHHRKDRHHDDYDRRKYDDDYDHDRYDRKGQHNHAMDEDFESRDGGHAPIGTGV